MNKTLKPDILAITEGDIYLQNKKYQIESAGGDLVIVSRVEDASTTSLIRKMISLLGNQKLEIASKKMVNGSSSDIKSDWEQLSLPLNQQ